MRFALWLWARGKRRAPFQPRREPPPKPNNDAHQPPRAALDRRQEPTRERIETGQSAQGSPSGLRRVAVSGFAIAAETIERADRREVEEVDHAVIARHGGEPA
jgi:hypothetical protein